MELKRCFFFILAVKNWMTTERHFLFRLELNMVAGWKIEQAHTKTILRCKQWKSSFTQTVAMVREYHIIDVQKMFGCSWIDTWRMDGWSDAAIVFLLRDIMCHKPNRNVMGGESANTCTAVRFAQGQRTILPSFNITVSATWSDLSDCDCIALDSQPICSIRQRSKLFSQWYSMTMYLLSITNIPYSPLLSHSLSKFRTSRTSLRLPAERTPSVSRWKYYQLASRLILC